MRQFEQIESSYVKFSLRSLEPSFLKVETRSIIAPLDVRRDPVDFPTIAGSDTVTAGVYSRLVERNTSTHFLFG